MTLKTSPPFRFLTRERFDQLVTRPTHIKGGEQIYLLWSNSPCVKISLYTALYFQASLTKLTCASQLTRNWPKLCSWKATTILTTAVSMSPLEICCEKVSLYLPPFLRSFHILTRCWTFSPTTHWSSSAVPRAHEPVHHLQNISPTPVLPTCSAMSTEPSQSKMTSTGTVGCDYRNILGLQLHNLFSPWMMIS